MRRILTVVSVMFLGCSTAAPAVKNDMFKVTFLDGQPESGLEMCIFPDSGGAVRCIKYETFLEVQKEHASRNTTDL